MTISDVKNALFSHFLTESVFELTEDLSILGIGDKDLGENLAKHKLALVKAALDDFAKAEIVAAAQAAGDVNKTMQAEAVSEHWPTYGWRPAIGFSVALAVLLSVLTVFLAYGAAILYGKADGLAQLPGILAAVAGIIGVVSPILGIASWYRGKMQADPNIPTINRG